jgi:hypothetical protein
MSVPEPADGKLSEGPASRWPTNAIEAPNLESAAPAAMRRVAPPVDLKTLLCSALLGSLVAWLVMCSFYPFYTIYSPVPNSAPVPRGPRELDKPDAFLWNMRLGYGVYGLVVGACLGVGYVLPRRSPMWGILGFACCGILGGVTGVAGGQCANSFFEAMGRTADTNVVLQTMIGQGLAWTLCGLGIGLGLGLLSKGVVQFAYAIAGCVISGIVAGALHAPLHTALFAENEFFSRLPVGRGAQLMWITLPAIMAATIVGGLKGPTVAKKT